MRTQNFSKRMWTFAFMVMLLLAGVPLHSSAQDATTKKDSADPTSHTGHTAPADTTLAEQLRGLQTKVAALEAALKQNHQATAASGNTGASGMQMGSTGGKPMGMGMMSGTGGKGMMPGMGGMNMGGMSGMGGMGGQGMGGMGMGMGGMGMGGMGMDGMGMDGMKMMGGGMGMMGQMQGMGSMQMATALPGFPGASHIYHVGSTNFFLDHPQHITLSQEQQTKLNQVKEQTLLGQATFDRWIDAGEQELWVLTSADAPQAEKIEAKVREIEKLRGDKRIAFIRAVGEAANVLTSEQRQTLVGLLPPDHAASAGNPQN